MTRQEAISVCRAQNCLSRNSWCTYPCHHILCASKTQYVIINQKKIPIEVIIRVQDCLQNISQKGIVWCVSSDVMEQGGDDRQIRNQWGYFHDAQRL